MLSFKRALRVLAIGAHPDDIELGAGGLIHRLTGACEATVHFLILTDGLEGLPVHGSDNASLRRKEAQAGAGLLGVRPEHVFMPSYSDCRLHEFGHDLIREIEGRIFASCGRGESCSNYDLILTHSGEDTHADHRAVHESTLSAVRSFNGTVLHYQSPSVKPNGFHPTFFARLSEEDVTRKDLAIRAHLSQRTRTYFRTSRTHGLADNWAMFLRQPEGTFLEAFEVYKSFG